MMKKLLLPALWIHICLQPANSQGIKGKVIDRNNEPVDAMAVILQTQDSVFVNAGITDMDGTFSLEAAAGSYVLYFQHILYEPLRMEAGPGDIGTVTVKEKENMLSDITVTAARPQVKVEAGKLIYDTPYLIQNKPVNNAYEAIKELPGVIGGDDELQLIGAGSLHVVINGKLTTMSLDQLIAMLKTIPSSRVKSTEVMYNAPARYNVKGALINVILDQSDGEGETLQGEVGAEFKQQHYANGEAHGNMVYSNGRFGMDVLINGAKGRVYNSEDMFARHTLNNEKIEIEQDNGGRSYYTSGVFRLGLDYVFKNEDKLSATYFIKAGGSDNRRTSFTVYRFPAEDREVSAGSSTRVDSDNRMQNAQIQYEGHQGLVFGVDYTNYYSPDEQHFVNEQENVVTDLLNNSKQNINKWMVFANHSLDVKEWSLNYGVNVSTTRSRSDVEYWNKEAGKYVFDDDRFRNDLQKEWGGNIFAEVSRSFGRFSGTVSLKAEYFRSDYETITEKSTLWNEWAFFPNASLSYMITPSNVLQFNVSSDKSYPSYWSVNPQTSYLNSYSVVRGNPGLKPGRSYEGQLMYIFRRKYIFMGFVEYQPDKFTQLPHQSDDVLENVFRFENLDYSLSTGLAIITPFTIGKRISSRVTLHGIRLQEKSSNFYETPFNNTRIFGRVGMNNTINISDAKPNLKFTLDGYYVSPAQQGVYRLGYFYDVSAGLKWLFAGERGSLSVKYNNIFRSHYPSYMRVDVGNQYSNMKLYDDSSYFGVAFTWKFGGYKQKQHTKVDDSRFGK